MTMLAQVALALCRANRYGGEHPTADDFVAALAAMQAMRKVTKNMLAAGEFALTRNGVDNVDETDPAECYSAMINAILLAGESA